MTSFEWKIENIRMAPMQPGASVESPPFYLEESKTFEFCLKLIPRNFNINLFLWRCDNNSKSIKLQYKLQIESGVKLNSSTFRNEFRKPSVESSCWEDQEFLPFSRFECCNIVNASCEILWHNNFEDIDEGDLKDLSSSYSGLLNTGTFSDAKFSVARNVYNVHKAILVARSPALVKSMDTKYFAKEWSQICCDETIFQKYFQYLYSGTIDYHDFHENIIYVLFGKIDKSILKRMSNSYAFFSVAKTSFQVKHYYFEWSVENFIEVVSNRKLYYIITEDDQWSWMKITMFLDPKIKGNVKFIIGRLNNSIDVSIRCKIDVKGDCSSLVEGSVAGHVFNNELAWEVPESFQIEHLKEHLQNGALNLVINLNIGNGSYSSNIAETRFLTITSDINHMYHLREDFKKLFECPTFHDITLRVGSKVFKAHKAILSARSSVFHDMFQNDMSSVQNGEVIIDDIRSDVLSTMLLFIYCGQFKSLDFDIDFATNLYYAANKYQVLRLRQKCSAYLHSVLNPDNAGMILILADTHDDENLKTKVLDFVCSDAIAVLHSEEWEDIISSRTNLLSEILKRTLSAFSN